MTQSTLAVPEMSCEACRTTIEDTLERLPGVASVSVDLVSQLVTVEHDARLAPTDQLASAVEEQGYEVASREAL